MILVNDILEFNHPDNMSSEEVGLAVYHIASKTQTSRRFTTEFIENVLLRASQLLYKPTEYDPRMDQFLGRGRRTKTKPVKLVKGVYTQALGGGRFMVSEDCNVVKDSYLDYELDEARRRSEIIDEALEYLRTHKPKHPTWWDIG